MTRTVVHDTFVIDRTYAASPARVYTAFADADQKVRWWGDDDIEKGADHVIDFRIGGRESLAGSVPDGPSFTYDAVYQDIVENERIVYSYEMTMNGRRISVSVATLEFLPDARRHAVHPDRAGRVLGRARHAVGARRGHAGPARAARRLSRRLKNVRGGVSDRARPVRCLGAGDRAPMTIGDQ